MRKESRDRRVITSEASLKGGEEGGKRKIFVTRLSCLGSGRARGAWPLVWENREWWAGLCRAGRVGSEDPFNTQLTVGREGESLALWQGSLSGRGEYLKRLDREWRGWAGRARARGSDTRRASGPLPSAACGWDSATPASPCCLPCGRWWPWWSPAPAVPRCPTPTRTTPVPPARANTPECRVVPCPHEELQWRLPGLGAGGGAGVQLVRMGAGCLLLPSLTTARWGAAQPASPHT